VYLLEEMRSLLINLALVNPLRAAAAAAGSQAPPEILMASPDLRSRRAQGDLLPRPL
jgi:hypothetical protein